MSIGVQKQNLPRQRSIRKALLSPPPPPFPLSFTIFSFYISGRIPLIMGGKVKIWNPVEIAEEAKNDYASQIFPSLLTIDPSLSLPQMTPLVMFVTLYLSSIFSFPLHFNR